MGLLRTKIADHPECATCQFGKQIQLPDERTTTIKRKDLLGSLKEGQLKPGDRVFCDQLESRVRGRLLHTAGRKPDKDCYCSTTIFVDAALGYIHVEFQVALNATDSINALDSFERSSLHMGVAVNSYHTDNGIFKSKRFVHEIMKNLQSSSYSGVGSKWQNGVSEGAISIIASRACTLMIHAALHWPKVEDASLWPLAVSHAVQLYNHTPNSSSGIALIEVFTSTTSDCQFPRNCHPWGCPACVLQPRLTSEGGKLPRWQPDSRRGQFVGYSPVHAESGSLIRNLTTGYISPQYHIIFDDWCKTVYSTHESPPSQWHDMCIFQRFETHFDEDVAPPTLAEEWLTPDEIEHNNARKRLLELRQGRRTWQNSLDKETHDGLAYQAPPLDPLSPIREPAPSVPRFHPREPLSPSWNRDPTSDISAAPISQPQQPPIVVTEGTASTSLP